MNKRDDLVVDTMPPLPHWLSAAGEELVTCGPHRRVPVVNLATAFCTDCRRCINSSITARCTSPGDW